MDIILIIILVVLLILVCVYHLTYVLLHKPKTIGTIIVVEDGNIYVELDGEDSLSKLKTTKSVVFRVSRK